MQTSKRTLIAVTLALFASLLCPRAAEAKPQAAAAISSSVPTPASVLGHTPGDDFYLANYDESRAYFEKLAQSSNRIKIVHVGKTTRGLDWEIAIISSPENLAALDKYKEINRRLTWARGLDDAAARALAGEGKIFVHIDGGMHSTEVAGAQHSIVLAYKLLSAQNDPQIDAILDNVILVLWPTLNPDGQNEVVAWYRKNIGTTYEVSPLPDLYQEYVGHDNNRDGYMNNMLESQEVTAQELQWNPEVFYTQHQTAPFPARIFIPPFVEPISSNIQPILLRWLNAFGINMGAFLDEHDMPGAIDRVGFDNWYPGFQDFTGIFRNSISFFTETALYGYATPHFYTVRDFPPEYRSLNSQIFYSSPWTGGWWRLGDAVRYMMGASMSVLDTAAKYREQLLYNKYQAGRDNIERFTNNPPYAYVIPVEQRDLPEAALLIQKMMVNGIQVHQATSPFAANGQQYPAGSWVILMDQPFAGLVKELFEPQKYPDLRENGTPIKPYDVAGWTLPLQMGVNVDAVLQPLSSDARSSLRLVDKFSPPAGKLEGSGGIFLIDPRTNAHFKAINEALAAGGHVSFVADSGSSSLENGTAVITGITRDRFSAIVEGNSLAAKAVTKTPSGGISAKKPRVGLYRAWTANIDEGWTRWILEQYGFAPITIHNGGMQASHLRDRFDAIILPDASPNQILNGFPPGAVPGPYVGGIGQQGVESLREFVADGGTLVTFNNASLFAIEQFGLPVTNVLADLKEDQFYCSGSLLRVEVSSSNLPGLWGFPRDPVVMFEHGPAFDVKPAFRGAVLASYPANVSPLASGYLLHPERIEGKAAALEAAYGKGRIYLFGFKPQWRAQSHGTYKFFFNAIYDSPSLDKPSEFPAVPVPVQRSAPPLKEPGAPKEPSNTRPGVS